MRLRQVAVWLATLAALGAPVAADDTRQLDGRPMIQAVRVAEPPVIDGSLDDEIWATAALIDQFVQSNPVDGAPASERTEVRIAYDNNNIYFAFYVHYSDSLLIRANRSDRDQTRGDDTISVYFDTFQDQQRAYMFSVNGYGVQSDAIVNAGGGRGGRGRGREDRSWDALFSTRGTLVQDGWVAEMAIPFKSLRYPARAGNEPHQWGFQIQRSIQSKDEEVVWSPVSRDVQGFLTQMGLYYGMTGLSTSRNLEVLPTLTAIQFGTRDDETGAYTNADPDPDFGFNVKYGVTSNLTTDFTYNPDFSQIEADRPRITVNERFPIFFEERRPFFLEGQEIFNTQINVIHTRTIVDPQYGGKMTGKVGKTTVGVLFANDEAPGIRDDDADPAFGRNANVFIGRARYDMYSESFIGAVVTDREFMDSYSRVGGVDGRFRLGSQHRFSFMGVVSDHRDEEGVASDGSAFDVSFNKSGRNFTYSASHQTLSPGFKTDLGFIRRTDVQRSRGNIGYRFWPQNAIINWGPRFQAMRNYDHDGVLQDEQLEGSVNFSFARNIGARAQFTREMERFRDIDFYKSRYSMGGNIGTSRAWSVFYGLNWGDEIRFVDDPFLGRTMEGNINVNLRPTARLNVNLRYEFERFVRPETDQEEFDVKTYRTRLTYQLTERWLLRNILEYDSWDGTFGSNVLATYRVNAGTVLFVGYDDRYERAVNFNDEVFLSRELLRTNRTFFMKFSYLFRY